MAQRGRPRKNPTPENQIANQTQENQTLNPTQENQTLNPTQENQSDLNIETKEPKIEKPKRGRPKKTDTIENAQIKKPKKPRKKKEVTIESIKMASMGTHALIAIYAPDAMISDANAQAEAIAIKNVIDQYDMQWLAQYFPIFALVGTIAFCEIPTVKAIKNERDRRAGKEVTPQKGNTVAFPIANIMEQMEENIHE